MFATIGAGADLFIDGSPLTVPACMIKNRTWDFKFVDYALETSVAGKAFVTAANDTIAAGKGDYDKLMDALKTAFSGVVVDVTASHSPAPSLVKAYVQWGGDLVITVIKNAVKGYEAELEASAAAAG